MSAMEPSRNHLDDRKATDVDESSGNIISHMVTIVATAASTIAATLKFSGKRRHSELVDAVRDVGHAIEIDGAQTRNAIHLDGEATRSILAELRRDQALLLDRVPRA